jgi:hypothetical protein
MEGYRMLINVVRWHMGLTASRISGPVLAAAVAAVLPLTLAAGPAGAAVRALPGQKAATPGPAGRVWDSWADDPQPVRWCCTAAT